MLVHQMRSWAEDEGKRAREQAKVLEDARSQWESHGLKVIVDKDLHDESMTESTRVNAQQMFSVEETETRAETLVDQLKSMAANVKGKSKQIINMVIEKGIGCEFRHNEIARLNPRDYSYWLGGCRRHNPECAFRHPVQCAGNTRTAMSKTIIRERVLNRHQLG